MIIGSENLIEWVRANKTPYWRLMNGEKQGVIISSEDHAELTVDDSIPRLQEALAMLSPGNYFIDAWYTGLPQNSRFKTRFVINSKNGHSVDTINGISVQPQVNVQEEIRKALADFQMQQENQLLKAENLELKNQVDDFWYRVIKRLEPYMGNIISGFAPNLKPVNGTKISGQDAETDTIINMATEQQQERLEKAFESWGQMDTDCIDLVEKIAKLAKDDPATYSMAKQILMKK